MAILRLRRRGNSWCSFRGIPLTVKVLVFSLIVGTIVWIVLDRLQSGSVQQLFVAELGKQLEVQARENRLSFDHYVRSHQQSAKLIISQQRFHSYVFSSAWLEQPEWNAEEIKHYYQLPPWLPPAGIMQAFFNARYALLIDPDGHVREVYHYYPEDLPATLQQSDTLLQKLSHNQTYMTTIEERPFILTAQSVADEAELTVATLMLVSPIDEELLNASTGFTQRQEGVIVAVVSKQNREILASSDLEILPQGLSVSTLEKQEKYLVMGTEFFDYGDSDLEAGFASFITTERAHHLAHEILNKLHYQRAVFAAALITFFALVIFWVTQRVKRITQQITVFSKESLGVETNQLKDACDEIDSIVTSFQQLRNSILNTIALAKAIAAGDYAHIQIRRSEQDQLGRALYDMNDTLQSQAQTLQQQQEELRLINDELEQRVARRTAELARANQEIATLNERLQAENFRMAAELDVAQRLQEMVLPKAHEFKQFEDLDIVGFMKTADEVGGDYYDILQYNGHLKIGIGDVTGHGLESGVLMLMVQTAVRTLLASNITEPGRFLNILNRTIYDNVKRMNSDKNLTLSLLDYKRGTVYLTGQHEEVLVVRKTGIIERIDTIDLGFMVGLKADISSFVSLLEIQLQTGDGIVLYTDGVTEAQNQNEVQYGVERLCQVVSQFWHLSAEEVQQAIITDVRQHIGLQKVHDDITLIVLKQLQLNNSIH